MSIPVKLAIKLGGVIHHEEKDCLVVRIVHSSSLFETLTECYILEEQYAELRLPDDTVGFLMLSQIKHPHTKDPSIKQKGLDVAVWRQF